MNTIQVSIFVFCKFIDSRYDKMRHEQRIGFGWRTFDWFYNHSSNSDEENNSVMEKLPPDDKVSTMINILILSYKHQIIQNKIS